MSTFLLVVCSLGTLALQAGCSDTDAAGASKTGSGDPEGAGPESSKANGSQQTESERTLDTGGALVAPFTCGRDAIQGEPRPQPIVLEQLRAAAGLDVLEERFVAEASSEATQEREPVRAGTPCETATDKTACESAFEALSSGGEVLRPPFDEVDFFNGKPRGYYLAYTKGDTVGKVSSESELRALFPAIDTPAKALLYANAAGYRVECHRAEGWIREEADGWVILASRGHERRCTRTDVVLWLKRDGTTEERDVLEDQSDPCT